jgi:site-specific DNA-methyltransferase (adenine-specific)
MKDRVALFRADSRVALGLMDAESIDAVVTDPPYEIELGGRKWDSSGVAHDESFWGEVHRVAKPGAYMLAFGGTRTFHRMAVAIEDAGFEIQDCVAWLYANGFPKHRSKLKPACRWPANVMLDTGAAAMLDEGTEGSAKPSRFYYVAKPTTAEREEGLSGTKLRKRSSTLLTNLKKKAKPRRNHHPTVKPVALMRHLVRLVTPAGGTVLDPFTGSGTTGCAAIAESAKFVGIELDREYYRIAEARIRYWVRKVAGR